MLSFAGMKTEDAIIYWSNLRRRAPKLILFGALLSVGLASWTENNLLVGCLIVFWGLLCALLIALAYLNTRKVTSRFGKMLEFVHAPSPLDSLFACIRKHGYREADIAELTLMTNDLGTARTYYKSGNGRARPLAMLLEKNPDAKVTILGFRREGNADITNDRCTYIGTKAVHTEHANKIKMKDGSAYLWFEPYHTIIDKKHVFPWGAYFIKLTREREEQVDTYLGSLAA
jgi:hypothetical protein